VIKEALLQMNRELAELRKFVVLLGSEQQSLLNNDTESLLALSEAKTQAASQLMEMGSARRKALLVNSNDNMEKWIAKNAPASQALWSDIRKLAAEAQHLNSTNGELIQSRMRNNQQALGVLYNSSKSAAGIYGPDGQANIGSSGRHLGSG
jgi:flagella synthesis protein FlgN